MSSTPTTRNGFDKQAYGDNPDLWGIQNLNTDLDLIDESLDGVTSVSTTGGTTTLDATNFATNQARKRILSITGVLVSAATMVIPNVEKWYRVINGTTGAYTLTIKTASGTGTTVTQGCTWDVHCDGVGAGTVTRDTMPVNLLPLASASLDMNTQKITGLLAASAPSDAARFDQLPGPPWYTQGGRLTGPQTLAVDTTYNLSSGCQFTMPASPLEGARMRICLSNPAATYSFDPNGNKINGSTSVLVMTGGGTFELTYDATTGDWE